MRKLWGKESKNSKGGGEVGRGQRGTGRGNWEKQRCVGRIPQNLSVGWKWTRCTHLSVERIGWVALLFYSGKKKTSLPGHIMLASPTRTWVHLCYYNINPLGNGSLVWKVKLADNSCMLQSAPCSLLLVQYQYLATGIAIGSLRIWISNWTITLCFKVSESRKLLLN